jgi:prepilin-type N-terminal cleavage/methylation domain-containing protein
MLQEIGKRFADCSSSKNWKSEMNGVGHALMSGRESRKKERGFTLVEMLIATIVVLVGLVAVAQLVPASAYLNASNRNDGTALVFAQKELEFMREQPLGAVAPAPVFINPLAVATGCTASCSLGDPTQPGQVIGSGVVWGDTPLIDFSDSATLVDGYYFTYIDPNDPYGASYDVRWAVISFTNPLSGMVTGRRIILGVFRRGMRTPTLPITLDTMVEK